LGAGEPLTLERLERLALERNPTLRQATAAIEVARGLQKQAGLYPNPVIHYHGEELGQEGRAGQHGPRLEQIIVTGGKLRAARNVRGREVAQVRALQVGQAAAVRLNVRVLFYQALAAQERIQVRTRLLTIASETLETSRELHNIGLVKESELLQAQVETDRTRLSLNQATADRFRVWQQLGAIVGDPELSAPRPLAGSLETLPPRLDPGAELQRLVEQNPAVSVAQAGVGRAEAMLRRQRAERTPNLNLSFGPSYDYNSRRVIWEVDLALPLPLFNRNQGNIQAAKAEIEHARAEVERVRLSVQSQFGPALTQYETSLRLVEDYRQSVLPTAARAYELTLNAYRRGAESFDQVLMAQRTFFQTQSDYVDALQKIQEAVAQIGGFFQEAGLGPVSPRESLSLPENPANPFP
jgi:cobalt-zinc-cadmium efflux system outer membrane protein